MRFLLVIVTVGLIALGIHDVFFSGPTPCGMADMTRAEVADARLAVQSAYKELAEDENQFGPLAFKPDDGKMSEMRRLDEMGIRDAKAELAEKTRALMEADAKCRQSRSK